MLALKVVLGGVILFAVGRHIAGTWRDLNLREHRWHVEAGWVAAALVFYLVGLCGFGVFFGRIMRESPSPTAYAPALRAYLLSHLGKYVPGKAMVVVMRVGLLLPYGARPATAAFATLYETLGMMSAGGLLAGLAFALWPVPPVPLSLGRHASISLPLLPLSLALGLALLVLVEPRVFSRLSALMSMPFPNVGPAALPRFTYRLLVEGLLWAVAGWTLLGLSQVAVVRALTPAGLPPDRWPVVIGSVALATVAGFVVAIFPGGLVVREGVLMVALEPTLGRETALVSALLLRLAWVCVELLAAAVLSLVRPSLLAPVEL